VGWSALGAIIALSTVLAIVFVLVQPPRRASADAVSTTDNPGVTSACLNGPTHTAPATNCNIYLNKPDVWLSGLPVSATLGQGAYFFAVLDPGGQQDPNDGTPGNLSTDDNYLARTFLVASDGTITNLGTHTLDPSNNILQLWPYEDTSNPGGEYILAVCQYDPNNVTGTPGADGPGVDPSACKYDAFKTGQGANTLTTSTTTQVQVQDTSNVPLGATVHDSATVVDPANAPVTIGSVTFTFYPNGDCEAGTGADAGTVSVDGNGVAAPSESEGPLAAGSYAFSAHYSGSGPYTASDSSCEPFTVNPATTSLATTVDDATSGAPISSTIALGSTVQDSATLTPVVTGVPMTGVVTFTFYTNGSCTGSGASAGSVNVNGTSGVAAPSNNEGPLAAGDYGFTATYSGDANYTASTGSCEPFTVNKAATTTVTHVLNASGVDVTGQSVVVGAYVHDLATVGPPVSGFPITGTVTYTFYTNGTCTGAPTSTQTVAVGLPSSSRQITSFGSYCYQATYSGDANYKPSTGGIEPFSAVNGPLTIGYWGNHLARNGTTGCTGLPTGTGCSSNGPWTTQFLPQPLGAYSVSTIKQAAAVFNANNCSNASTSSQNAVGCLSAQLLGAELNVANHSFTCITSVISQSNAFLVSVSYVGPTGKYTLTTTQRSTALALQQKLATYNQGGGC
jgi:hypothetical protein